MVGHSILPNCFMKAFQNGTRIGGERVQLKRVGGY